MALVNVGISVQSSYPNDSSLSSDIDRSLIEFSRSRGKCSGKNRAVTSCTRARRPGRSCSLLSLSFSPSRKYNRIIENASGRGGTMETLGIGRACSFNNPPLLALVNSLDPIIRRVELGGTCSIILFSLFSARDDTRYRDSFSLRRANSLSSSLYSLYSPPISLDDDVADL